MHMLVMFKYVLRISFEKKHTYTAYTIILLYHIEFTYMHTYMYMDICMSLNP